MVITCLIKCLINLHVTNAFWYDLSRIPFSTCRCTLTNILTITVIVVLWLNVLWVWNAYNLIPLANLWFRWNCLIQWFKISVKTLHTLYSYPLLLHAHPEIPYLFNTFMLNVFILLSTPMTSQYTLIHKCFKLVYRENMIIC